MLPLLGHLLLLVFLVGATPVYSLTCHCVNSSRCDSNGYCTNGCANLWSGPGCQVGPVARFKAARQSTTLNAEYVASAAVDGMIPNDYHTPRFCTHTTDNNPSGTSWWVVTLDSTNNFVILNVTLDNRINYNSNRLSNFVILYSNESEGDPDPNTWHEFARENGTVGDSRTYTPNDPVIAKRVAVYLKAFTENPQAILSLCEVSVIGYELHDCQSGFTGPGCLLRACDQCNATGGNCTGEFGSCRYDVCLDQSLLPPDCWKTLSNISRLDVISTATCNSMLLSAVTNDTRPNIAASWLQLQVTTLDGRKVLESTQFSLRWTNAVYYNFSNAIENTSYNFTWKFVYCDSTNSSCFPSTGSKDLIVRTGKREYAFNYNNSCIFVNTGSTIVACEPLYIIKIVCQSEVVGGVVANSSNSSVCGLESEGTCNCTVTATVNTNTIEIQSGPIIIGQRSTSAAPKENITATIGAVLPGAIEGLLPGAIGGSVVFIAIILAIVVIFYCRRQQNAKSHAPAVELDGKPNDSAQESSLDVTMLPSFQKEQCDNPYESLHKDLQLKTGGEYSSLYFFA